MKVYHHPDVTEVLGIGDTHGVNEWIPHNAKRIGLKDAIIFHVGDFGIGFNSEGFDRKSALKLNDELAELRVIMYVIRGNHDNPKRFDGTWNFSNLVFLQDYDIVSINEKYGFLCVGGAISIDRKVLLRGKNWWPEERFTYDPSVMQKIFEAGVNITHVITHTSPDFAFPIKFHQIVYNYANDDYHLIDELIQERKVVNELYTDLSKSYHIKEWVYGHFHHSHVETIEGTKFRCLGIKEMFSILQFESDDEYVERILGN